MTINIDMLTKCTKLCSLVFRSLPAFRRLKVQERFFVRVLYQATRITGWMVLCWLFILQLAHAVIQHLFGGRMHKLVQNLISKWSK